ncbi:MAG: hypothetical protein ACYCZ6_14910 [Polaromonas sp.]
MALVERAQPAPDLRAIFENSGTLDAASERGLAFLRFGRANSPESTSRPAPNTNNQATSNWQPAVAQYWIGRVAQYSIGADTRNSSLNLCFAATAVFMIWFRLVLNTFHLCGTHQHFELSFKSYHPFSQVFNLDLLKLHCLRLGPHLVLQLDHGSQGTPNLVSNSHQRAFLAEVLALFAAADSMLAMRLLLAAIKAMASSIAAPARSAAPLAASASAPSS